MLEDLLSTDMHVFYSHLTVVHAGALLAVGMMVFVASGLLRSTASRASPPWAWIGGFALFKSLSAGAPLALGMVDRVLPIEVYRLLYLSLAGCAWTVLLEGARRWHSFSGMAWRALPVVSTCAWLVPLVLGSQRAAGFAMGWCAALPASSLLVAAYGRALRYPGPISGAGDRASFSLPALPPFSGLRCSSALASPMETGFRGGPRTRLRGSSSRVCSFRFPRPWRFCCWRRGARGSPRASAPRAAMEGGHAARGWVSSRSPWRFLPSSLFW
ncbi:MAG: hypothetical protein ACREIA_06295 [Opitutaceae bacterium]